MDENKELKQLRKDIRNLYREFCEEREENRRHREEVQPLLDLIKGSIIARKVILWGTSLILAIGSVFLLIKGGIK